MDPVLDALENGVLLVEETHTVTTANAAARELLDNDDPIGTDVREVLPRSVEATFHGAFDDATLAPTSLTFEEYFPQLDQWLRVRTVPLEGEATEAVLAVTVEDISGRKRADQRLRTRSRELETMSQIIGIIETIVERLTQVPDRAAIDEYVCEGLLTTDLYDVAWIASRDIVSGELERRSAAGTASEEVVTAAIEDGDDTGLEQQALTTGEVQVAQSLAETEGLPESIRRVAFAQGLQSGLAVPFVYGDTTYGVLGIYTARTEAFREAERGGFDALGTAIGYVIHAIKQEQLLLSDSVVELTFGASPQSGALARAASALDTDLRMRGIVPRPNSELTVFVEFSHGAPGTLVELLEGTETVQSASVVREYDDGGAVEVDLATSSMLATLLSYGGTIKSAEFDTDGGSAVAEFAPSDSLSEVVETVTDEFDGVELVAKHDREPTIETAQEFKNNLREELTDRQEEVLRTTYLAGYFENPRGSTGEDVADSMDISSPTLHHHLRAAQRKLLDAFFSDSSLPVAETDWDDRER